MIHRNDERVFRLVEISAYLAAAALPATLRLPILRQEYAMPLIFSVAAFSGIMFMARFFVYAYPERVGDRTRAARIELSRSKKIGLIVGAAMCIPMLILGCIGLVSPGAMDWLVTVLSPLTWLKL